MELLKQTTEQTRLETYVFQHEKEGIMIYKEWLDDSGKVIDWRLEGKHGETIHEEDSPGLLKEIWEHVDQLEQQKIK
jgi:hypothetical protein